MKKLISILFLYSLFCGNSHANENLNSFQKKAISQNNGKFTEYKAQLTDSISLSFFVDKEGQNAVPVLVKDGKKYQPISIEYCIKDSDDCWRQIIYHNSLSQISYNLDKPENRKDLLNWKIEYLDNNQIYETDFTPTPLAGALPDGDDDYDPYILWQYDLSNF